MVAGYYPRTLQEHVGVKILGCRRFGPIQSFRPSVVDHTNVYVKPHIGFSNANLLSCWRSNGPNSELSNHVLRTLLDSVRKYSFTGISCVTCLRMFPFPLMCMFMFCPLSAPFLSHVTSSLGFVLSLLCYYVSFLSFFFLSPLRARIPSMNFNPHTLSSVIQHVHRFQYS